MISNPVVRGFSPDPSVCRVGSDYFLATSTLEWWPGIPIRHSTDLIHWEIVGHAVTRPSQYRRDGRPGRIRLYAPTLRHHDGRYYLTCTNVADGQGNFLVSTDDPAGNWSDATWLDQDAFDPSLTFDEGSVYYTRRTVVPGRQGSGPVVQANIDPDSGRFSGEVQQITPGESGFRSNDIEGPHLYRIGEWWYLLSAEGGTWKGHMATIARSRSPWGPFEGFEGNPILTHRNRVGHEIQSTGHAELVDDSEGNWWAVFLGTRHAGPAQWHHLGRETFLAPVTWSNGWPIIGNSGTVELALAHDAPLPVASGPRGISANPWTAGWMTFGPPRDGIAITLDGGRGPSSARIVLPGDGHPIDHGEGASAAFVAQSEFDQSFSAVLETDPELFGCAGLTVFASPQYHYDLVAAVDSGGRFVMLRRTVGDMTSTTRWRPPYEGPLRLEVNATSQSYEFVVHSASDDSRRASVAIGSGSTHLLSGETTLTYYGASFGVIAEGTPASFREVGRT